MERNGEAEEEGGEKKEEKNQLLITVLAGLHVN